MANKKKSNNFIIQGSILAIAGLIVRLIGLLYRIPLTNIIGEEGIGVYSTAYSVYDILLLLSSYSLPLAVSRIISSSRAAKAFKSCRVYFICALIFGTFTGTVCGLLCFFGADLAAQIFNMPQASTAIKTLAPTIFIMAFLGVLRGYFQGHGTMVPTAVSQIIEQIVHAVVSLIAGYNFMLLGISMDAEQGLTNGFYKSGMSAAGATLGTGAGALFALLFFIFLYFVNRPRANAKIASCNETKAVTYEYALKVIALTVAPVLFSSAIYHVINIVDQTIFGQYYGTGYNGIWGAYNGKYNLLTHIPTAIASAVGSAVVPALAAAAQQKNRPVIVEKTETAIRFNMLVAIPAATGLAVLATPIMNLLFSSDNTLAAKLMLIGSSSVIFTAISTTTNSVLQGIGKIWIPVRNAVVSLVVHSLVLVIVLFGFDAGIEGLVIANILFYVLMTVFNNINLPKCLGYKQELKKTFFLPLMSSAILGVMAFASYRVIYNLSGSNLVSVVIAICIGVLVYAEMLIVTGALDEKDLLSMPKGKLLV
ncbi:MAG: polysaccharide biosynthesis protein, partial [Lachnospiraceae bacterium]|nr:polysaccharide biosynthesis protein [Candidatus Minthocola equi]